MSAILSNFTCIVARALAVALGAILAATSLFAQPPASVDKVFIATASGISLWSSDTRVVEQMSTFPSYEIELSPQGQLFVGNGGADSVASGVATTGIFRIDAAGVAVQVSDLAADDLEFDENGDLYAANAQGIWQVDLNTGMSSLVSSNPTSQFAFESPTSVVTTNGLAYFEIFFFSTERIDLTTDTTTFISASGAEDVEVTPDGRIFRSGTDGVREFVGGNDVLFIEGFSFDVEFAPSGNIYIGNSARYDVFFFPPGLDVVPSDGVRQKVKDDMGRDIIDDINSIEVLTVFADQDGDGVPDEADACPTSDLSPTVVIDSRDTGVANQLVEDGCSISDLIASNAAAARNHGDFVNSVTRLTNELQVRGLITGRETGAIKSSAARAGTP